VEGYISAGVVTKVFYRFKTETLGMLTHLVGGTNDPSKIRYRNQYNSMLIRSERLMAHRSKEETLATRSHIGIREIPARFHMPRERGEVLPCYSRTRVYIRRYRSATKVHHFHISIQSNIRN